MNCAVDLRLYDFDISVHAAQCQPFLPRPVEETVEDTVEEFEPVRGPDIRVSQTGSASGDRPPVQALDALDAVLPSPSYAT
jgi:hypothetical protein